MSDLNPYSPPKGHTEPKVAAVVVGTMRDRCPVCDSRVSPWKVVNAMWGLRCAGCRSELTMGMSNKSFFACIFAFVIPGLWHYPFLNSRPPTHFWVMLVVSSTFFSIFARYRFGHLVAKRPPENQSPDL